MRSEIKTREWFLRDPRCMKWIIQCSTCLQYGRKSDTPDTIPKRNFEVMFPIMVLDEKCRCEQCHRVAFILESDK